MAIRWGIVGCGDVTEVKSGPGFQQAEGSELVAVMRRDGAKAEDYARRHDVPRWYADADALIHDKDVDAVYIATPPGSHLELALKVCAAGKPAYVEKPMARNHAECQQMIAAFEQANVPLFVAYYRRALPRFLKAKEIIESGVLGTIENVHYIFSRASISAIEQDNLPWRLQAEHAGGGIFLDIGCHTLDILDFLIGPLQEVRGKASRLSDAYDVEDKIHLQFETLEGAPGFAHWNFAEASLDKDFISIKGEKLQIVLSTFGSEPIYLYNEDSAEAFDLPNPKHIQQPFIQSIVDELHGMGECPGKGVSAARTSLVMDTALDSYYGGRQDAFWTRPETWPGAQAKKTG